MKRFVAGCIYAGVAGSTLVALQSGCSESPARAPNGIELQVAPLDLPGIGRACYDARLTNAADGGGEVVWSRGTPGLNGGSGDPGALCSDRFGNLDGGDISYVAPCDADDELDGDAGNERVNSVTIWLDGLYDSNNNYMDPAGPANVWQNPCEAPDGCTLNVTCEENADTPVTFNLTIMRAANQGFFDIAVNFEDIYCSAKLDTCYADGDPGPAGDRPIRLVFGADDDRDWTAVMGLACTSGGGTESTEIFYGPITVDCGTEVFTVDPTVAEGETSTTGSNGTLLHYAVYYGAEGLDCGGGAGSCQKRYWNITLSLDDLAGVGGDCTLTASATAADVGDFVNGLPTGVGISYPYVDIEASLTTGGVAACQQNELNGSNSAVITAYHGTMGGLEAPVAMCASLVGETPTATGATGCGPGGPAPSCNDDIQNQDETGVDCGGVCPACPPPPSGLLNCEDQPADLTDMVAFEFTATLVDGTSVTGWYAFSATNVNTVFVPSAPHEITYYYTADGAFLITMRLTSAGTTSCYELDPTIPGASIYVANDTPGGDDGDGYGILDLNLVRVGPGSPDSNIQPSFFLFDGSNEAIPDAAGLDLPLTPYPLNLFSQNFITVGGWGGTTTGTTTGTLTSLKLP